LPGEWLAPSQPFPVKPAPLVPLTLTPDDAWGFTFWDRRACRKKIETVRNQAAENDGILQCTCGGVMIRVYSKPALRELTETEATALRESLELPKPSRS